MFTRLAHAVTHYPRWVFGFSLVILAAAFLANALITPNLSTEFELGDSAESQVVADRMRNEFGMAEDAIIT